MTRPSVALAMIVKNEAHNLPRLFKSIEGCFDEIHITDTGSTDDTVEIAKANGAQVHHFEWVNDFAAARNASFAPVKTDYVVWLDADDCIENPEAFKLFRDTSMGLSDFHLVPYHYASDASGKPVCTFSRERVFKVSRRFQWRYFIHEGVTPDNDHGPVQIAYCPSWAVRHMRTEADIARDKGRNLGIFEYHRAKGNKLDARMQYYYGKELFEAGRPIDAVNALKSVLSTPELEIHDRILAYQYICYAYMACGQFVEATQVAMQGILLVPQRAELFAVVADCYLKMGRIQDAAPFYAAAKGCIPHTSGATPIFTSVDMYTAWPRNQLARIAVQRGDLDSAEKELVEATTYGHPETSAMLETIRGMKTAITSFDKAEACDDIVFTTAPQTAYPFDPAIAQEKSMGGSETALIEMAKHLKALSGRRVIVFNMRDNDAVFGGVEYKNNAGVHEYFKRHKPYFHVAWRHNMKLTDAPTFVWCHDLATPGLENHAQYERALVLTPFHHRYTQVNQGIPAEKLLLTRNGIEPGRFIDGPWEKDPNKFVFSSSPDRGLDRAMRVLDRVREKRPEIKLHVFYGIEHLPKWGHQALHDRLKGMMKERSDWVIYHGATQQDVLMREFKTAAYAIQPSDWIETSMISAVERLCCGIYQIMRAVGGVCDTLRDANERGMAKLLDSDCITELQHAVYAEAVLEAIQTEAYKRVAVDPYAYSWEGVARQWLEEFPAIIEGRKAATA